MTIALDASLWDEPTTGIGLYTHQLARALSECGVSVERWGARQSGESPRRRASRTGWTIGTLPALLEERRPSVYHAVANFNLPLRRGSTPLVLTVHDLVPLVLPDTVSAAYRWQFRLWMSRSLKVADRIICISQTTAQSLAEHFPVSAEKCAVISLGVDHLERWGTKDRTTEAWLDALGLPTPFVLYAGALDARKNVQLLLDAGERLEARGRRLTVALAGQRWFGASAVERRVRALRERGLDIRALGYLSEPAFYGLMRRATVFVFPSRYEGFGLPPLEAMSLGVPTVVADAGSLPEVCGDGALRVGVDDVEGLASIIERLLTSPAERDALSRKGRERARQFSWRRAAEETVAVYRSVAAGPL